jgi:endonuclease-3
MTRLERASIIGEMLDKLYPEVPVPLDHEDPYTLLIAVLLSAQCTDKRVNLVTPALFAAAHTPEAMAALPEQNILELIRSCGLAPQKAKAIKRLSEILSEEFNGKVPANFKDLESLPGVGHKTASVVMAQAFGVPAFPVDTHIHRLAKKWKLSRARSVVETEKDLKKVFPEESWNRRHLQMIFYGREYSPARGGDPERDSILKALTQKTPGQTARVFED